jgi:invasion protein IalB
MLTSKNAGRAVAAAVLAAALSSVAAEAATHHKPVKPAVKPAAAAGPAKPMLVGTYGDWGAYSTQGGKAKICYALAQPKERTPASLKKEQAYIFISNRPAEGVKNEISVIMGVPLKEGAAEAKAEVGAATFDLVSKGQNAWVKNAADETRFIDAMKKGSKLTVKGTLVKGGAATDSYSLSGLGQALDRVVKDCQ